jgi:hypothetical protein
MNTFILVLLVIYAVAAVGCVLDVIITRRASGSAFIWSLVILFLPLGVFAYMFFGSTREEKKERTDEVWRSEAELKAKANAGILK